MLVIHSEMMDLLNPTYNSSDRVLFLPKPPPIKRDTEKRENIISRVGFELTTSGLSGMTLCQLHLATST